MAKVLVISAHPDDEVLGVGGTILKHVEQGDEVSICIVTKSYPPEWSEEYAMIKLTEGSEVDKILGVSKRYYCSLPTVKLNLMAHGELSKSISKVVEESLPDIVYTHYWGDVNKDHRLVFEGVMVAVRPLLRHIKILCFETVSSTEWYKQSFSPNFYVDIKPFLQKKVDAFAQYKSEVKAYPHPRSLEGVKVKANCRGIEAGMEYAESFVMVKDYWC